MCIYDLFSLLLAKMWLCSGLLVDHFQNSTIPCSMWATWGMWGRPGLELKSTVTHIRASFGLFGWLTCGSAKAYLRPKSGKHDQTAQNAVIACSMWSRCWIWARIKINVAQIWASSAFYFYFCHGWHAAFLWLACGPNFANRSGPP